MLLTWEIAGVAATLVALFGGIAVKWITSTVEQESKSRAASAAVVIQGQLDIKDDIKTLTEGFERRVERLELESRDYRPGHLIDQSIDHAKRNVLTVVEAVRANGDSNGNAISTLRDRVTVLETKHEATSRIVAEIKSELKDTRHEINERFDQAARASQMQFEQLCQSIREISKREQKP